MGVWNWWLGVQTECHDMTDMREKNLIAIEANLMNYCSTVHLLTTMTTQAIAQGFKELSGINVLCQILL
jgi:hypothetical protein